MPSMRVFRLAHGKGDGKPVLLRWQRAGGVGSIGARGVLQAVEIQGQLARLVEPVVREIRIEEARSSVAGRRSGTGRAAGRVAQDKEKLLRVGIFEDRLKLKGLSVEGELGQAGRGHLVCDANDRWHLDFLHRDEGNPLRLDAIFRIRSIPVQTVEIQPCESLGILDAERVAASAMK